MVWEKSQRNLKPDARKPVKFPNENKPCTLITTAVSNKTKVHMVEKVMSAVYIFLLPFTRNVWCGLEARVMAIYK